MRKRLGFYLLVWGFSLSLLVPSMASAIDLYGRIRGVVMDPSGAVIAGATVTATNTGTGIGVTTKSATDGSFEFLQLPAPATYDVKCEQTGFKTYTASGIRLAVTQIYVQNISMVLGQVAQQVTVEAAPTQVEKTSIQLAATITSSTIVDMPLNGRNWIQLQQTLPGVVASSDRLTNNFSTNGSQTDSNSYLVNGVDTNDLPLNTPLLQPSLDAIAEFNMVTNTINPEYGRNSGAVLNAILKSGSNSFHGTAFDFFRDTGLNARTFFQRTPSVFHQHMFGGEVGGPIWRDKTFFMASFQGIKARTPQGTGNTKVFTGDQRGGLFPSLETSTKLSVFPLIGSPTSTVCPNTSCPAGTAYKDIFPDGQISAADINPISKNLLAQYVPVGNYQDPNSGAEYYQFNPVTTRNDKQIIAKVDHTFSDKDSIWGSFFWETNPTVSTLPFSGANLPGFAATNKTHLHQYVATWNHTFGPTTLNEMRLGYTRLNFVSGYPVNIVDPSTLGFTGIVAQEPSLNNVPVIGVTGYFTVGYTTNGPQPRIDQTRQFDDNFSKIMGKHTLKAGFNVRAFQVSQLFFARLNGSYTFSSASSRYTTGNAAADFMLGIPRSYLQGGGDRQNIRSQEYYSYFQDQFRWRPNLTLTIGTGWSIDTPTVDNYHSNHAMVAFRPGQQSTVWPNSPEGYVFQGDAGVNATGTTKYGHFGPRFGFAWDPTGSGKWSIRGGYGIYFNRTLSEQLLQFVNDPPYAVSSGGVADVSSAANPRVPSFADPWKDIASNFSIANKFPSPGNPPQSITFDSFVPLSISVVDPNYSTPYSQNYNLTIERQLPANTLFSIAYVGSVGRHLLITRELNPGINAAGCAADPDCAIDPYSQITNYPQNFKYPNTLNGTTVFGSVGQIQTSGISNYNSMQVTLNKKMSHGLQFLAAYTWSRAMDDGSGFENSGFGGGGYGGYGYIRGTSAFNQSLYDYGPSGYDARQRFVVSYTYDLPPIRHVNNFALKRVLEGWRLNGITTFQTGFPLDVIDSSANAMQCSGYLFYACPDVPNVVAPPKYVDPKTSSLGHQWFDPSTFAPEAVGQLGNAGRYLLRGPGIANFDFGFYKQTAITEKTKLELRFEFFNVFNHTQFSASGMDTDIYGNFGAIVSTRDPRLVQLSAKFYF